MFQGKNANLDHNRVVILGLLYCRGDTIMRINALFKTFDLNGDGDMFINSLKRIIIDLIMISCVIVPAIADNKNPDDI